MTAGRRHGRLSVGFGHCQRAFLAGAWMCRMCGHILAGALQYLEGQLELSRAEGADKWLFSGHGLAHVSGRCLAARSVCNPS